MADVGKKKIWLRLKRVDTGKQQRLKFLIYIKHMYLN